MHARLRSRRSFRRTTARLGHYHGTSRRAPESLFALLLEEKLGTNPYKFGMIGATDSHTSLATAEEDNFFGKHTGAEPKADRASHEFMRNGDVFLMGWQMVSSGYAGVWATDNSREAIWDAMRRKEVYATTGPRMLVRFVGGWEFTDADAQSRSPAFAGYAKGVPMGGDLSHAPEGKAPTFLLAALKDPLGGNLDRVQVVNLLLLPRFGASYTLSKGAGKLDFDLLAEGVHIDVLADQLQALDAVAQLEPLRLPDLLAVLVKRFNLNPSNKTLPPDERPFLDRLPIVVVIVEASDVCDRLVSKPLAANQRRSRSVRAV